MHPKITAEVVQAYLNCPYKAHLKLGGQTACDADYARMQAEIRQAAIQHWHEQSAEAYPLKQAEQNFRISPELLSRGFELLLDPVFEDEDFELHGEGIARVAGRSKLGSFHYVPVLVCERRALLKADKLQLALWAALLAPLQGKFADMGLIFQGSRNRATKVRLSKLKRDAEELISNLRQLRAAAPPPLILNDHCSTCGFRQRCRTEALDNDNLTLLRGIGPKEIKKYHRKGILTLTQLSHTFRPRRKGKRGSPEGHKRYHALQAMAIRDKTIYVLGAPELPARGAAIYLDLEGDPSRRFVYLIGMLVVQDGIERRHSFWADEEHDERSNFERFLKALSEYEEFTLYAWGSYERSFLKRMQAKPDLAPRVAQLMEASVNVLSVVYSHIYFPTYSNGLKEIGSCLKCLWTEPEASGLQSIVWRRHWEQTRESRWKESLLQYNQEDCSALRTVSECVRALVERGKSEASSQPTVGDYRVSSVQEIDQRSRSRKWGKIDFVHPDYEFINGCAYFNYQRQRVYVQTNRTLRRNQPQRKRFRIRDLPVRRHVEIKAETCESCGSANLTALTSPSKHSRAPRSKRAFDLCRITGGIRLKVIECRSKLHRCLDCGSEFVPKDYRQLARYGHGLKSWAIYQHISHQLSFGTIRDMVEMFFELPVEKSQVCCFKADLAQYYEPSYQYLREKILSGPLLQVDETQFRLKGGPVCYIWAFTNLEEAFYVFRPTREGGFLHEMLKDFRGVLVSDFYTAYDSLECPQQKCLVHLIRDMNDDLRDNPFDEDLKSLTQAFGMLLRPIVATINEHGLRKRQLRKFMSQVDQFFDRVESLVSSSDAVQALRQRLLKYRSKLFTFLNYDGVPWNNNNAEHAIKRFALYRAHVSGMMHESGVISFLTLLSVCQSCKCKNLNFWRFLFSREQLSDAYRERKRPAKLPDYEVDPRSAEQMTRRFPSRSTGEPVVERNPKLSSLGAVVKTLEEVGKAMTAEQLVKAMTAKGYWTTRSKRPAGSLRAHLLREIERNREHARIARAGKMTFTLPKNDDSR